MSGRRLAADGDRDGGADDRRARSAHRDDGAQHPRPSVARPAPGPAGPRADRLLRPRARGADRPDPRAAGGRVQARGDQPPARQRRRLQRRGAAIHPGGQGPVRGRAAADRQRRGARRALGAPATRRRRCCARPRSSASCARSPTATTRSSRPRLGRASAELAALGIPPETALEVAAELRKHSDAVAKIFVELFIRRVWKPFEDQGRPEHDLPGGPRRARAAAPARLRRAAGDVPAGDDRGRSRTRIGRELERIEKRG